jgi:drug/metabolite transporter (DMT)-like permease
VSPARPLDARGAITALLLAALWGGNPVAVKIGLADAPPLRLAAMRFVLGGVTVLVYALLTRRAGLVRLRRGEASIIWSLGLLLAVQIGLMNVGANLTSAAHGAILINAYAIHTVLLAHFFIPGDRLTHAKLVGVLVAYAGIVVLFAGDASVSGGTWVGDLVLSASAFLLGERTVYMARAVQRVDPIKLLLGQSAIGATAFLAASLLLESAVPTHHTSSLALVLVYQGVVIAGFNFVVNAWLLQRYLPSAVATCMLTTPIWGVLIAAVAAGDRLTPALILSSVMVAVGIGIATRRTR